MNDCSYDDRCRVSHSVKIPRQYNTFNVEKRVELAGKVASVCGIAGRVGAPAYSAAKGGIIVGQVISPNGGMVL